MASPTPTPAPFGELESEPTPTPEPTPPPTPPPTATPDAGGLPGDTALAAALEEPLLTIDDTGANELLSTAISDGLSNPFAQDYGGWDMRDGLLVDPEWAFALNDALYAYTGQIVDTYSGTDPTDRNPNAYTTNSAENPFQANQSGKDTSQWLASNDQQTPHWEPWGPVLDPEGNLIPQQALVYNGQVVRDQYGDPVTRPAPSLEDGPSFSRFPGLTSTPPPPTPPVTAPTSTPTAHTQAANQAPAPTSQPLPPLPAPLPPLPAPDTPAAQQTPAPGPTPAQGSPPQPAAQPATPAPGPSFWEQAFPTSDSFAWRQYESALNEMQDPRNSGLGRAAAGLGALFSSIYSYAERFVIAPILKAGYLRLLLGPILGPSEDLFNILHEGMRAARFSEMDINNLDLILFEFDFPLLLEGALGGAGALGVRGDAAFGRMRLPAGGLGTLATPRALGPANATGIVNDTHALPIPLPNTPSAPALSPIDLPALPPPTPSRLPGPLPQPAPGEASRRAFTMAPDGTRTLDAVLNPADLRKNPGSLPPAPGYERGLDYDRSHLGGRQFNFPNTPDNSITLAHEANAYGKGPLRPPSMLDFEQQVAQALRDGQTVSYRVTAISPGSPNPEAVVIQARGSGPNGIDIDAVVRNWTHH